MQILSTMMILSLLLLTSLCGVQSLTIFNSRLSEGRSGTVQVFTQSGWQNLCSSSWSTYYWSEESRVLCRQLGYDVRSPYPTTNRSSSTSTSLYFSSLYCSGSESTLSECRYSSIDERPSCSYIVSVTCPSCTTGSVQLRGGVVPEAGTVEYCVSGTWKAVCDTNWNDKGAFVVCRQLGFPATDATAYSNSYFGDLHLLPAGMYFRCYGNESSLSTCQSSTSSSCDYANTAGVYCAGDVITELCIDGHMRLVGGRDTREGRVEICDNGLWGTIYSGGWDSRDATVVCRQLGLYQPYSRVEVFYGNSYFGARSGPVVYALLNCAGTESTLRDCRASNPLPYGPSHAGVRCNRVSTTTRSDCSDGDVRLVNGTTPSEGRVEICYDGVWGSVCDSSWSYWDAAIVCLQLNFQGTNATALTRSYFGDGTGPFHLSGLNCGGEERTLLECSYYGNSIGYMYHICGAGHDAGVRCDASTCTHGDVRLFGGYSDHEGIAEVCINGFWADICDDGVSNQTVRTFCRQFIGMDPQTSYAWSCCPSLRRRNTGNITLYGITCSGQSGSFIQDCTYSTVSGYSSGGCSLQEELIVGCYEQSSCTNGDVRLRGGNSTLEGRVELCNQGLWGTVVADSYWNYLDARVVCRQLGYPWEWALAVRSLYGRSPTRHVVRSVQCSGTESRLTYCSNSSITTSSSLSYARYDSAGVICQGNTFAPTQCERGKVRLVGGRRTTEGRVEVCAYGYWATACYRYWDTVETEIVCKQLGFPSDGSLYTSNSSFGPNYDLPIVSVSCGSGYTNISQCGIVTLSSNCNHRNEIGIFCRDSEIESEYFRMITVNKYPEQQSYAIGSQVTLNCSVNSRDNDITYRWYSASLGGGYYSGRTRTITIQPYIYLNSVDYYCQIFNSGRLLGAQRLTLDIKDLLQSNVSGTNTTNIQVRQQETVHLYIEPVDINILNSLLGLTWYHNGSVIGASQNQRYMISNRNKTLTITTFTYADAGVYEARFNQLFVHPFDEHCRDEVLSLLRHLPVLKPAVFCVNMEGSCPDKEQVTQLRTISVTAVQSALNGTLNSITLRADGKVVSSNEFKYTSISWYRNGGYFSASSYTFQKHYTELSLNQERKLFNVSYEDSGRYEVVLRIYMYRYLREIGCKYYQDRFVSSYLLGHYITLAEGYVDVDYYKDLSINLTADKEAATRDEGATLTCRASIGFPPFSMVSFIKNGETVANSTSGLLQIDTQSVNANPFGVYICQLNASGLTFNETIILKNQAIIRITIEIENTNVCSGQDKSAIEDAFVSKITSECQCSFDHNDLHNSSIVCNGSELVYTATVEYSTEDGSETASVIAERIVSQAPFAMAVGGMPVTVTSACSDCQTSIDQSINLTTDKEATTRDEGATLACSDCQTSTGTSNAVMFSQYVGGGLFAGGLVTATVVIIIIVIVIVVIMKTRCTKSEDKTRSQHSESQLDPTRYSKGVQGSGVADPRHSKLKVEVSLQKDEYEEMAIDDQPIYEETF